MKLYMLDDNGAVVFEFSDVDADVFEFVGQAGGTQLTAQKEARRVTTLLKAALKFLQRKEK